MVKRFYRAKDEIRKTLLIKIAVCAVLLVVFFSLLVAYSISSLTETARCLKQPASQAVLKVAANGGYAYPESFVGYNAYSVPLYRDKDVEAVPSMDNIKAAILLYVKESAPYCSQDIKVRVDSRNVKVGRIFSHAVVDVDMEEVYDEAIRLYEKQKHASVISLAELARMAKNGDYIMQINANNDTVLYLLSFTGEGIGDAPLVYSFGIRR